MRDQRTLIVAPTTTRAAGESRPPLVVIDGLVAGYAGPPALESVSFSLEGGQRAAILGPNGGGKTTLFRVLVGELAPRAGTVAVAGRCGVVAQTERSRLDFPVTALDVALMGAISTLPWWRRPGRTERARAMEALATVGLADRAQTSFGDLSGGQRQRVLIARALVQDADVVLLDEPFTGLDAPSTERLEALLDRLAAEGRAVLIATHDVQQARRWDRVLCLNRRQIAFGPPGTVLDQRTLELTYGRSLIAIPAEDGIAVVLDPDHARQ